MAQTYFVATIEAFYLMHHSKYTISLNDFEDDLR